MPFILIILLVATQTYLLPKVLDTGNGHDFRLIWLAGQLWSDGISPYSESFFLQYERNFGQGPVSHFWVYPPYWWIICRPLAMLSFEAALLMWNLFNYILLAGTAFIFTRLPLGPLAQTRAITRFAVAFSVLSIVQATPFSLALGQTSFLILAGVALLLMSVKEQNCAFVAIGTALVMLKPNFGVFIVIFLVTWRWTWVPIALIAATYLSISLIVAAQTGLQDTLFGFLDNLSEYDAPHIPAGQAANLTGIIHLADLVGIVVPKPILYGVTTLFALAIAFAVRQGLQGLACISILCAFMIPLHTYDMAFCLLLVVVLSLQSNQVGAVLGFAAAALLVRPDNIGRSFDIANPESMGAFAGSLLASIALALGCVVAAINTVRLLNLKKNTVLGQRSGKDGAA